MAAAERDARGRTYCERYRHDCEVRHVAGLEHEVRAEYFKLARAKRGAEAAERLRADVVRLLNARVRGAAQRASLTALHDAP